MVKIYVDGDIPKKCVDCPCEYEYYCNICNCELVNTELYAKRPDYCPIKPISDLLGVKKCDSNMNK